MSQDYYQILGIARDAGIKEIQAAAQARLEDLKLRMNEGTLAEATARAQAQQVKEIFSVLKDPARRGQYDAGLTPELPELPVEIENVNPYRAPDADLEDGSEAPVAGGNLDDAVSGNYDLAFADIFRQAWELTYGLKGPIWLGILLIWIIFFGLAFSLAFVLPLALPREMMLVGMQAMQVAINILSYPLTAGLMMIGIHRAAGLDFSFMEVFNYFGQTLKLLAAAIIMGIFIALPLIAAAALTPQTPFAALLALPAVYLFPVYFFTFPLITEKGLGIWAALEVSRRAVTTHWFSIVLIYLAMGILSILSALPFGIGLIWTVPMMFALHGILYRTIFGVSQR